MVLALTLGVSIMMLQEQPGEETPSTPTTAGHTVDYFLENFQVTTMGVDGKPERSLQASTLRHYLDDETTEMDNPYLTVNSEDQGAWEIRSDTGWLSADGELVLLTGAVDILRQAQPGIRPMHLVTRDLRVQPGQHYAETDADVFISSGESTVNGTGMQAWLKEPARIKLLNQTRGHYVLN